jgi:hypothetical protein
MRILWADADSTSVADSLISHGRSTYLSATGGPSVNPPNQHSVRWGVTSAARVARKRGIRVETVSRTSHGG